MSLDLIDLFLLRRIEIIVPLFELIGFIWCCLAQRWWVPKLIVSPPPWSIATL